MFKGGNQLLLVIAGTLLVLATSSSAISTRTYAISKDYRFCQKVSFFFDRISQNVTENQLTDSFVKFCTNDESGAKENVCRYIASALLPVYKKVSKDNFCFEMYRKPQVSNAIYDSSNCDECVSTVNFVKSEVSNPQAIEKIQEKLLSFCETLPSFESECSNYVNTELNSILAWIQNMQPYRFCEMIHFCSANQTSSSFNPSPLLNFRQPQATQLKVVEKIVVKPAYSNAHGLAIGAKCEVCDEVMKWTLKILANNKTEKAIEHTFDSLCSTFYKHNALKQAHCSNLVDQYTVQLINFIVQDVKPDSICHLLDFCPSSSAVQITLSHRLTSSNQPETRLAATRQVNGPSCLLCIELFRYVYKRVNANHSEAIIENTMDEACELLYKVSHKNSRLNACKTFVANNAKLLIQLIKSNAGPTLTCLAAGACATPANNHLDVLLIEPSTPKALSAPQQNQFGSICQKMVTSKLFKNVKSAENNDEILVHLTNNCKQQATAQDKSDCSVYVYKQHKALVKAFVQADSKHSVCSLAEGHASKSIQVSSPQTCELCKLFVGIVYKDLKENKTQAEIVVVLDKLCVRFSPSSKLQDCQARVQAYVTELINIIESASNPAEACSMMGYCGSKPALTSFSFLPELTKFLTSSPSAPSVAAKQLVSNDTPKNPSESPFCQQCIKLVTPVHNWLSNKSCENDLLNDVARLCSKCPDEKNCNDLLQSHIKWYFDSVDKYSDPSLVCHHLGFCSQARTSSRMNNMLTLKRLQDKNQPKIVEKITSDLTLSSTSVSSEACYECQLITQYVQTVMTNATVQHVVIDYVKREFCDPIPSRLERKICDDFFDRDGPLIIQHLVSNMFDSKRVCEEQLHFCPNKSFVSITHHNQPDRHRMVGASKCTYGPAYWCKNKETAIECKSLEYCSKKFWKTNQPN